MGVVIALVIVVVLAAALFAYIRAVRYVGRSSRSSGPSEIQYPPPPGQEQVPWELLSIAHQLPKTAKAEIDPKLLDTVNRLVDAAGLPNNYYLIHPASPEMLNYTISALEARIGLEPLYANQYVPHHFNEAKS